LIPPAILGAVFNRIRGAGHGGGTLNVIAFGVFCGFVLGWLYALPCALAMWAGQQPGWGVYIGAMRGNEKEALKEFWVVDWFIQPLKGHMQLWGWAGMTLRGLWWTGLLALASLTPWVAVLGLLMPMCYWLADYYMEHDGDAWEWGEVIWGTVLWSLFYINVVIM
jgi:hypothetical protein